MSRWLVAALAFATFTVPGCSRASEESGAKKWADEPPPRDVPPPKDLSIEVIVDGAAQPPINAATLTSHKADFEDAERSAWLITNLVPAASPDHTVVEAVSPQGVSLKFERPGVTGLEPVLFLTRRGEVIASVVDPKDPFPRYHGQGGRLHRAGDSFPRVAPVAKLVITHAR